MVDSNAELRQLNIKRGQIKASLTRFSTFVDKVKNNTNENLIMQLEKRLEDIDLSLDKFENIQTEIELLNDQEITSDERLNFENTFYEITQTARKMLNDFHAKNSDDNRSQTSSQHSNNTQISVQNNANNNQNLPNVTFPAIDLPKFYGDYEKWGQFRDMFLSLIHNDPNLDNIKKFYYLLSCVKGDAAKVIECIEVTNDNYNTAWDLLVSRYQNESVIIKHHVSNLIELPGVGKNIYVDLRNLTDALKKHIRSLESLGEPVEYWDTLLFYLITKKLDFGTQREWESLFISKNLKNEKPKFSDFIGFLEKRCLLLETINHEKGNNKPKFQSDTKMTNKNNFSRKSFSGYTLNTTTVCPFCQGNHQIYFCEKFKSLPVASRANKIVELKLCANCLRTNHITSDCKSQGCKKCKQLHNTLLHLDGQVTRQGNSTDMRNLPLNLQSNQTGQNQTLTSTTEYVTNFCEKRVSQILLSTAIVLLKDSLGNWHQCRALLDSGSQPNFITSRMQYILNLSPTNVSVPVMGVGSSNLQINKRLTTTVKSIHTDYEVTLPFLILDKITENLPSSTFNAGLIKIPSNIVLADDKFNISREIDIILGASIFYELICANQLKLGNELPFLQQTKLGWVISGTLPMTNSLRSNERAICNLSINKSLENSIEKFWKIEEVSKSKINSIEEQECEDLFIQTTKRDDSGHYVVTLPLRGDVGKLGHSLDNAVKRLYSIEKKFIKNPEFKNQYINFMQEYESLGHMTQIDNSENDSSDIFYLPHHGVIKESSLTTKLRVVFDGSCKSSSGISLNDLLKVGPTIQNDLFTTLLRFRQHNVVVASDISKMYRQVMVAENQRDLQRIVWRSNNTEEIKHYQLNTVTYGTSSAAFLAVRSLQQVAIENRSKFLEISDIILNDFYVDDLLTGTDTIEQAISLKQNIASLLNKYGFKLCKWLSNKAEVLEQDDCNRGDHYLVSESETKKTLGLLWQASSDVLTYEVDNCQISLESVTKRIVLSSISKLFDPLGLLSPIIVIAKIMMQSLWQINIGWDSPLSDDIADSWLQFSNNLQLLNNFQVPRQVILPNAKYIEIHGFCDASLKAYAACIYIKSIDDQGNTLVRLLCSKTKVAPLKTITLPRLELCGALLLSELCGKAQTSLNLNINRVILWSDSTIALSWITSPPSSLKIFVGNRVSTIQNLTSNVQWRHVPTEFNISDIASRGTTPDTLIHNSLWWNGPEWLLQNENYWPKTVDLITTDLEKRKPQIGFSAILNELNLFSKFSILYKLQRVTALCLRFINNLRNKQNKEIGELTIEELNNSLLVLVKIAQREFFHLDVKNLENSKSLTSDSRLKNLDPFIDSDGLLRVGGRLSKSSLSYDAKHQLILPPHHALTRLIILNEHHRALHAGSQTILYSIRQRFWILNGRNTIRNVITKCVTCFRINPRTMQRKMADLPVDRVTPYRPFYVVGVDFAGPFIIKSSNLRSRTVLKAYLCVFVCFTSKAVHLELVNDLSTNSFLNTFKRFVARRGLCRRIYSDNGSNFIGASKEIKELYFSLEKFVNNREIIDWFLKNNIEWKFIPPYSPHRGGLWEAAVRQAKFHLKRIVGKLTLTFEDLYTVFTQIEAIMNSRPLCPLSCDPNDFSALTPGHFLIGQSLSTIPQTDFTSISENRLKQYQVLQQALQFFWKKWSHDYLNNLQQRSRWHTNSPGSVNENSMVLLIEENCPPLYWKLGRIVKLYKSDDGIIRTVTVRTQTGLTVRPIQRLCILPICESQEEITTFCVERLPPSKGGGMKHLISSLSYNSNEHCWLHTFRRRSLGKIERDSIYPSDGEVKK